MSKDDYEAYIVVVGRRRGERYAERKHLNVPLALATGNYERLSDLAIREVMNDLIAEDARRLAVAVRHEHAKQRTGTYDPLASQIRRAA